ncbi:hypothetical protein I6N90_13375 [Paenibacillus sp. GSMTC-2017]|uniref:hypothetical protein n=1 Tax=Paenibacillus sp. GSMTC-2017 TaxID=2794350 RepID=UPI001A25DA0D|nr:hypothetical protein [Paenibacillus sp. GSMTC-2017]MBH5318792.1 hypothetical protein [Paenibacillus sp. GSMTC-2017]
MLIYYIQKLPIIGKLIKGNLYSQLDVKKAISIIAIIITQLFGFALRFLYVGLLLFLPVIGLGEGLSDEDRLKQFVHIFAMISFVAASVSTATILEPKREKYVAVKLMRMSPTRYMQATFGYRYLTFFVYLVPAMLIFGTLAGASFLEALLLAALITLWRIAAEYGHLKLFEKTGIVLIKQTAIVWVVIFAGYVAAYVPILLNIVPPTEMILLSLPAIIVITAGGLFAAIKLVRYTGYREVVDAATKRDDPLLDLGRMMTETNKKSVESKDSDYTTDNKQKINLENKEGFAYLNAIFFHRHRSLISSPVNKRLAIIGAVGVVGVMLMLLFKNKMQQWHWDLEAIFPFLFLIMYFLSVGETICKAMFYNCDLSLMRYSFYRSAAYEHFKIRLGKIIGMNLLIAATVGVAITAIHAAAGGEWLSQQLLMLWLCVILLSIFVSIHHMFMYYIFQPYSTELNVKNPLYYAVNMLVSAASGVMIFSSVQAVPLTIVFVALTIIYLVAALVLVRKFGAKTFRVK